jgi:hypothetical protein
MAPRYTRRLVMLAATAATALGCRDAMPAINLESTQSATEVGAYDFLEVTVQVGWPRPSAPFTEVTLEGWFETADGRKRWRVDGFCDAADGSLFRVRFTPPEKGDYRYSLEFRHKGGKKRSFRGSFRAVASDFKGPIRVDSQYPWHFVREGTGEHYFFNGTTAYWLFGFRDDSVIDATLERLARLKVNRARVTIAGRSNSFFGEPVSVDSTWTLFVTPWPATQPEDVYHPGFDYSRFDVAYWQKIDRAVRSARDKGIVISLVLDMSMSQTHVPAGSDDEKRFIRYAIARLGAFENVNWDLGDDLNSYRDAAWAERTGELIRQWDPYRHLVTTHFVGERQTVEQPRASRWVGFTSFQNWTRKQHEFMLEQRAKQESLGHRMPQTNEEYGYEDHYPLWAPPPDAEAPDVLRRMAWQIEMAGGYQTTGETAKRGTNIWPNTGGGWMNGRGDSTMTMLVGYAHAVEFFTSFEWWKADPHDELVTADAYCLADPGRTYAVYLPHGVAAVVRLVPGRYRARAFNPLTGEWIDLAPAIGPSWVTPAAPTRGSDWAILLERQG